MARGSAGNSGRLAVVWMCMLLSSTLSVNASKKGIPSPLIFYQDEIRVAPGKTVVLAASPNLTSLVPVFGTIYAVSNILRESESTDSAEIGRAIGTGTFASDLSLYLDYVLVFNTSKLNGSLSVQGLLYPTNVGVAVINGGTGDFLFVRGYSEIIQVSSASDDVVTKNIAYLKFD